MKYPKHFTVLADSILADGVRYRKIKWGSKYKHYFHVVEINLDSSNVYLKTLKARSLNTALAKLQNTVHEFDSLYIDSVLVAVNANFWRAYSNYPIGPTVIDGEMIEMETHKNWTSCFIDAKSHFYIDNFFVTGQIRTPDYKTFEISYVNRRLDSNGVVIYNQYAGDVVPVVPTYSIANDIKIRMDEVIADLEFADSTDFVLDSIALANEIISMKQMSDKEFNIYKSACLYVTGPAVNKVTKAVVTSLSKGLMNMPLNGFIISYGSGADSSSLPQPGDTITVKFSTNIYNDILFQLRRK